MYVSINMLGSFTVSTQTLTAFSPYGTKWTNSFGPIEDSRPSAITSSTPSRPINLHLVFVFNFALKCQYICMFFQRTYTQKHTINERPN